MNSVTRFAFVGATLFATASTVSAQDAGTGQSRVATVGGAAVTVSPAAQVVMAPPQDTFPAVRAGEYESAPWLDVLGGPSNTGRILQSTHIPGIAMQPEDRNSFLRSELLYVVAPSGGTAAAGQLFLAFSRGDAIGLEAQVLVPTGLLRVEQSGVSGEAAVARVLKQFGPIQLSDALIPFVPLGPQRSGVMAAVSGGLTGRVIWAHYGAVLPGVQSVAIVDVGSQSDVRLGDVFTLLRPRTQHESGTWLPEKEIARGRVVRVTPQGATLLIIDQTEPAVRVGLTARLSARMP
jgi:hypothetical protein